MKTLLLFVFFNACLLQLNAGKTDVSKNEMPGITETNNPIDNFWAWFIANQDYLKNFERNPDQYLSEVLAEARKIKQGLAIELDPPVNGIICMTISANGNTELFSIVEQIIAKAPKVAGWKFTAFRQRLGSEQLKSMKLKANGFELDPGDMKFYPVIKGDELDIIIYVNGVTDKNYNQVAYGGLLILDNILGEYDCVTKVNSYDFHPMPESKAEQDSLMPLLEIAGFVDNFHSSRAKNQ